MEHEDVDIPERVYSRVTALISNFSEISRSVRNWPALVPLYFGIGPATIESDSGTKRKIGNWSDFISYWNSPECTKDRISKDMDLSVGKNSVSFTYRHKKIAFAFESREVLGRMLFEILEHFQDDEYGALEVLDKDVVDIGAGLGETAIYFASRGASHVYAFEPFPYAYERALLNVERNGFGSKVTLVNNGCGGTGRMLKISESEESSPSSTIRNESKGRSVKVVTLSEIVETYKLDGAALKIDCEGCEYGLLLKSDDETLRHFDDIIIEYHYGPRSIVKRLKEAGFKVEANPPKYLRRYPREGTPWKEELEMYMGIIHATRT
jgi:FkbM family methyltransferase